MPDTNTYISKTAIKDLLVIARPIYSDDRGQFSEIFKLNDLEAELSRSSLFVQGNHSLSKYKVFRGFHAEEWNKLIYITTGKILCVFVDIRPENFMKVEPIMLDAKDRKAIYIPEGVANSFVVLSKEPVNYVYLNDGYYQGQSKRAFAYNDPDLKIKWPFDDMLMSEADKSNPSLRTLFPERF